MRAMKYGIAAEYLRAGGWAITPEMAVLIRRFLASDTFEIGSDALDALGRRTRADNDVDRQPGTTVGRIPLRGVITPRTNLLSMLFGGGGLDSFRAQLAAAVHDDDVDTILLDVDSPGGSTDLVHEAAQDIQRARQKKPVVAVANTDAGSAAYWLASQADELVVTPSGSVGSVGVFALHVDESGFDEKLGIKPTFISAGKYKVEGNPHEPLSESARDHAQTVVDAHYARFVDDVAEGRGVTSRSVRKGFGEGRMVMAEQAVAEGMADRVDTYEATVGRLLAEGVTSARTTSSERGPTVQAANDDEDRRDEEPRVKSRAQVERDADTALADAAIARSAN